ncbi:MAG TPA: condensation domain-containing protein, partial [Ktedonobacteraceae bacterium]
HSLLAIQLISSIRADLHVEVPLRTLWETLTLAKLAEKIEELLFTGKRQVVQRLAPAIRSGFVPLSFAQLRLWFLDQLDSGNPAYNISSALHIGGPLHRETLERSLQEIVRRHEILRTTFVTVAEHPAQVIAPDRVFPLQMVDLSALDENQRAEEGQRLGRRQARRSFDLSQGPLLRWFLLCLREDEHVLIMSMHHSISDGWSVKVFLRELNVLYRAFVAGEPSPLAELSLQYADFAIWQREYLQGEVVQAQLAYWKLQLRGTLPMLDLPLDHPRAVVQTYRGAHQTMEASTVVASALQDISRQEGVTLFMLLLAAFQVLLYRYSGQEDIVVGTPITNRNRAEIEGLIGFFSNTVVIRSDLSGNPTFQEFLRQVKDTALGAYANQEVPFEKLVEVLQPERDLSRPALFQVLFLMQDTERPVGVPEGLALNRVEIENGTAKFDLALSVTRNEQGLYSTVEYNTDLFEHATIKRFLGIWHVLLDAIVHDPGQRIAGFPLITQREYQRILVEWNATQAHYPLSMCLHSLIEEQIERTPEGVAVVFGDEHLTYRELDRRADVLAHFLQRRGIQADVLVGVCMERSPELVISLLGIVKAGGAYLPLDPSYPKERQLFMLRDAQCRIILTQQRLRETVSAEAVKVVCLDSHWSDIAQEFQVNQGYLHKNVQVENLAYMIYTSGSTGLPKGAMITHQAICNRLLWMQDMYHLTDTDRVMQKTPFSFDVSVWEFFWPLLTGARIVLARPGGHQDAGYLLQLIREQGITVMHFVPSMLNVFLEERELEQCQSLREVICSGEALSPGLQKRFFARLAANLQNLYGPTEAAVDVSSWP